MVGTIAWGHLECFFFMAPDLPKDSNMECTVISRTLDVLLESFDTHSPGRALPRTLIINADNTAREAKNQYFATYMAYLRARRMFEATRVEYMQVEHTHNEQDQRFLYSFSCKGGQGPNLMFL